MLLKVEEVTSVLMDYDKAVSWNPALTKTQVLARPHEELMLTYHVTCKYKGGQLFLLVNIIAILL